MVSEVTSDFIQLSLLSARSNVCLIAGRNVIFLMAVTLCKLPYAITIHLLLSCLLYLARIEQKVVLKAGNNTCIFGTH